MGESGTSLMNLGIGRPFRRPPERGGTVDPHTDKGHQMNSRENGPGKVRRAKDRQEKVRTEKFASKARELLSAYAWSEEETAFLMLVCENRLPFSAIKPLEWRDLRLDRGSLFHHGGELYLSPETVAAIGRLLADQAESKGYLEPRELLESGEPLFSSETARTIRKALSGNV
jgi:integrase